MLGHQQVCLLTKKCQYQASWLSPEKQFSLPQSPPRASQRRSWRRQRGESGLRRKLRRLRLCRSDCVRRGDSLSESATRWPSFWCVCDPLHPGRCHPDTRDCYCLRPNAVHFTVSMGADVRRRRRKRRRAGRSWLRGWEQLTATKQHSVIRQSNQ